LKKLELLAIMYALEALLENAEPDKAKRVVKKIIAEAEIARRVWG